MVLNLGNLEAENLVIHRQLFSKAQDASHAARALPNQQQHRF